jgi:hypothetical protein
MLTTSLVSSRLAARQRGGVLLVALVVLAVIVVLIAGYFFVAMHWSYSDGERAGVVQKLSHKGWICKTWEGELAMSTVPGVAPVIWSFTVRDKAVVDQINLALGKRVILHYAEHRGIPTTCFGETPYFVDRVRIEADK